MDWFEILQEKTYLMGQSMVSCRFSLKINPSLHHPSPISTAYGAILVLRTFGTAKANGANGHAQVQEGRDLASMGRQWEDNGKTIKETQETIVFSCNFKDLSLDLHSECAWDSSIQPQLWSGFEIYSNTIVSHHNIISMKSGMSKMDGLGYSTHMSPTIVHTWFGDILTGIYIYLHNELRSQWLNTTVVLQKHFCQRCGRNTAKR